MSNEFEWQTEDDDWQQQAPPPVTAAARSRKWWLPYLVLLLLLLATGGGAYYWLEQRAGERESAIIEDVLHSHALIQEAARRSDSELYRLLLSGRDPAWAEAQIAVLEAGLLYERAPLGFRLAEADGVVTDVTLFHDLQVAQVTTEWSYTLEGGDGHSRATVLRQTDLYRQGAGGWLLAPADPAFWGYTLSGGGRYVTVTFPRRDELLGRRLAADLEEAVALACRTLEPPACQNVRLEIELATGAAAVAGLATPESLLPVELRLVLPAPTLAGIPVDEAGYRALARGYAARAVAVVLNHDLGWDCCRRALFYQALLDKQLALLGLRAWPLTDADYRRTLRRSASLDDISRLWHSDAGSNPWPDQPDAWLAYALVDFVLQGPAAITVTEMQEEFLANPAFQTWLRRVMYLGSLEEAMTSENGWARFLQAQALAAQAPPPTAWPDEDLLLMCTEEWEEWGRAASLHRYDPAGGSWTVAAADRPFLLMIPLPGGLGALLIEGLFGSDGNFERSGTILWQDGREVELGHVPLFPFISLPPDPSAQYLPLLGFDVELDRTMSTWLLDLESCRSAGCRLLPVSGMPIWSPNGSQTILLPGALFSDEALLPLQRGGKLGEAPVPLPVGARPFWLDETTYGYLPEMPARTVVVASTTDDEPVLWLQAADLGAILPGDVDPQHLFIDDVAATTTGSLLLLVRVQPGRASSHLPVRTDTFLLAYDWSSGELAQLAQWEGQGYVGAPLPPLSFSPDGRWLLVSQLVQLATGRAVTDLYLYDLWQNEKEILQRSSLNQSGVPAWSPDSRWFARLVANGLVLTAPGYEYDYLVPHDFGDCMGVAWVGRK